MMKKRIESGFLDALATYFHHATLGLGPELETYQNVSWGEYQKDKALATMVYLNEVLAADELVAGTSFSMADITAIAALNFADALDLSPAVHLEHLHPWRGRMSERDFVKGAA